MHPSLQRECPVIQLIWPAMLRSAAVIRESIEIPPHLSLPPVRCSALNLAYEDQTPSHSEKGTKRDKDNGDTPDRSTRRMAGRFCMGRCGLSGSAASPLRRGRIRSSEEGHMCPACIASTAVMVAGAGSTGGILAVCIGKFRKFFRTNGLGLFQKTKEK